jgi:hypothetical protein
LTGVTFKGDAVWKEASGTCWLYFDVNDLGDLPGFDEQTAV